MQIVGYTLSAQDNDSYMFEDDSSLAHCSGCGYRLDFLATNPLYLPKKTKRDLGATYDGQFISSLDFRNFCKENNYKKVGFRAFKETSRYFHLVPEKKVEFDSKRRGTRFEKMCTKCKNYESVVGATPAYLKISKPLANGIYRSDLMFASGNEKHPLLIVGIETKANLLKVGLKGLEFSPAYGLEK